MFRPIFFATTLILFPTSLWANNSDNISFSYKNLIFDRPLLKPTLSAQRSTQNNAQPIEKLAHVTSINHNDNNVSGCLQIHPYDSISLIDYMGQAVRSMANNSTASIETISIQPHFSGLKGPNITIMRKDLENAIIKKQGSAQEIYHNANFTHKNIPCTSSPKIDWDIELSHHIDLYDSDKAPLIRSNLNINNRLHFGRYFLGTSSLKIPLYDNLEKDTDLRTLDTDKPIRQDILGHAWQGLSLDRLMLSGFHTIKPDTHIAIHTGYLEEMFFGFGGEFLYRPNNKLFAIGAETWATYKRTPYTKDTFSFDNNNKQISALLNLWYELPDTPITFGLSAGRFLDGDHGAQFKTIYKPNHAWEIEGYVTYTDEKDRTLRNTDTNLTGGLRLSMPLGQFKHLPRNSRQTINIKPFARDKGQRVDNPYPLYNLTSPWHTKNIHNDWNMITAD